MVERDITSFLEKYELSFSTEGKYLYVHEKGEDSFFEIYITAIQSQFAVLFDTVLPEIADWKTPARLPINMNIAKEMQSGHHGIGAIGKVITLYFNTYSDAVTKSTQLAAKIKDINGPAVLNRSRLAHNIYGPFNPTMPHSNNKGKIHGNRFRPIKTLKNDVKGLVVKGYLIRGFLNFCTCILKQGKKYMWADDYGRHMHHRLHWQYEVHEDLKHALLLPSVYVYRENEDETLLVTQFIKGRPLSVVIADVYKKRIWRGLTLKEKNYLLHLLIQVLNLVEKLHQKGYVHRDLTAANFMLNRKKELYLLDFELAYNIKKEFPSPPFHLGTPGYMSPEQRKILKPDYPEDIYTLGALMVKMFTTLTPGKFRQQDNTKLENQLFWFVDDIEMARTITMCFNKQPKTRPSISFLQQSVIDFKRRINQNTTSPQWNGVLLSPGELKDIIERTYHRLVADPMDKKNALFGVTTVAPTGLTHMELQAGGLNRSISAFLFLLPYTKENSSSALKQFTREQLAAYPELFMPGVNEETPAGLFSGGAGNALVVHMAMQTGAAEPNSDIDLYLEQCFALQTSKLTLSSGIAGQGLTLLWIKKDRPDEFVSEKLSEYTTTILNAQSEDGSWPVLNTSKKTELGLLNGVAGILLFLLLHYKQDQDQKSKIAVIKGFQFLLKQASLKKRKRGWPHIPATNYSISNGLSGMAAIFILAYEILKEEKYKDIAESILENLPAFPISSDYSLLTGMAGMGLILLRAEKNGFSPKRMEQAGWIAQFFYNTFHFIDEDKGLWNTREITCFDPGIFTGFTGVLWFMEEYRKALENKKTVFIN
jgi:serine/threonine protein kinase